MGREVRRVPKDWQHPVIIGVSPTKERWQEHTRSLRLRFRPLMGGSFTEALREWDEGNAKWLDGFRRDYANGGWKPRDADDTGTYAEWAGERPTADEYMPEWPESERTHLQMYETTTEGTPISPVMETPEQLAQWLADNGASAFGDCTATYEHWLAMAKRGWAPSGIMMGGVMMSGVEGMTKIAKDPK